MDFKKSFKSKHLQKISFSGRHESGPEELPILQGDQELSDNPIHARKEFTIKIDGTDSNSEVEEDEEGGGLRRISKAKLESGGSQSFGFIHNNTTEDQIALDMDEDREDQHKQNNNKQKLSPITTDHSREIRVSFGPGMGDSGGDSVRRRHRDRDSPDGLDRDSCHREFISRHNSISMEHQNYYNTPEDHHSDNEVLSCTANDTFNRKPSRLATMKTKSRLQDPSPEEIELKTERVGRSEQLKSGLLNKGGGGDDDDDPLLGEDLPEEYLRSKCGVFLLLEWVSLISIVTALICTLSIDAWKDKDLFGLHLWKWEVLVLVLICGRLVSGWGIRLIVFCIERNFLLRKRVLYFVYGLKRPVQNCFWLGLVLVAWICLFNPTVEEEDVNPYLHTCTKVLICLLIGTILWLLKTLMVKVLASSFHVSTYFDRIQESLFYQYVIETLSGPPVIEIQRTEEEHDRTEAELNRLQNAGAVLPPELAKEAEFSRGRSDRVIGKSARSRSLRMSGPLAKKASADNGITIDHLHKLNHKNISAWNMKRLMKIVRYGSLSTLDEHLHHHSHVFDQDESAKEIRSENEAKSAARKIFKNVAQNRAKYIYLEDLLRFMEEDEALKTMGLFEGAAENSRISKSSLKNWVVNAFRERRALALTLNDTKTAVNKLHHMVNVVVAIMIVVISVIILDIATSKDIFYLSSQLVLVAFVFGNTCKTIFESLIFLFIIHPFDVGDRCEIDGIQMVVEEMNILTTVFLRFDNLKIIYPNNTLATKPISNFYRSPDMCDTVEFCIHIATPAEKIAIIRQRVLNYCEIKKEHWNSSPLIIMKDVEELNRIRMAVWLISKMNHQDVTERWSRRSLFVEQMVVWFNELDIQYRLYPVDINVLSLPPVTSDRMPSTWATTTAAS